MNLKFGSWHHRASSRRENTGFRKTRVRMGGCGRRMADGAFKKKKKKKKKEKKKENRMLRLLNLLVNCHLLTNASFGYFFF